MTRRGLFASLPGFALLVSCSQQGGPTVSIEQAKAWADDIIIVALAAAQTYMGNPNAPQVDLVRQIAAALPGLKAAIDRIDASASDVKAAVTQLIQFLQSLLPLLGAILSPATQAEFSLGLAVLQAFINNLPAPKDAPERPVHLHAMAARLHPKGL